MSVDGLVMNAKLLRWRAVSVLTVWALCVLPGAAPGAQEINPDTLPMFGQPAITRPDDLKKADEVFIKNAVAKHGNRTAASLAAVAQGWASLRSGKSALALRHFNEGWLLSPDNPGVFWGFGAVLSERGKLLEAIEQLETARELMINDAKQLVQLLADIGAVRSAYAVGLPRERELERAQQFSAANQRFSESLELDPEYAPSWRAWAISLYDQERYSEAWIKASRARELKAESLPADLLSKLKSKIAVPK
jgi:tetratricopeptide (TPR) repeat protein